MNVMALFETHSAKGVRSLVALGAVALVMSIQAQSDTARFELVGSQRTRYETLTNQFRADLDEDDRALALQTTVYFDWRRENLQLYGEIMDSRAALNDARSYLSTSGVNTLEPVQAYVAWRYGPAEGRSTLRAGRMTLDLGKRRLVARSRFRSTVDSFMGLDWDWHGARGRQAHAFYFRPMNTLPGDDASLLDDDFELDEVMPRNEFFGVYYQLAPLADGRTLELYAFEHRLRPTTDPLFETDMAVDHLTIGTRFYRTAEPGRWSYEVEAMAQRGTSGNVVNGVDRFDLEHRAHFLHVEVGYQLERPWSPNVVFQYDLASGDENPNDDHNQRFDTLFGDRSFELGPTGIYGIVARANLRSPGVRVTFRPRPRWRCAVSYRRVWLDEPADEWPGSDYIDASGTSGRSVGRHLETSFAWDAITDRLTVEAGISRLAAAGFPARAAGPAFNGNPRYFYLTTTTSF
jgi:hypothetical protein